MARHPARRSVPAALACVALLFALAGCGEDSPTTASSASPSVSTTAASTATATASAAQDAACADAAALKASLEALTQVEPLQDGLTALNAAIAEARSSLDTAVASASAAVEPDVEQVRTAFADLQTAASGLTADNLREKAPSIATALRQVATATSALGATLSQRCAAG